MSDIILKEAKKAEHIETDGSNKNENDNEGNNESEEKVEDKISKDKITNKDEYINSYDQSSTEGKRIIKKNSKNVEYLDKEIQNPPILKKRKKHIIQRQTNFKIKGKKDIIIKEYEEKIKILKQQLKIIEEKDKIIIKLSRINLKLQNSLELISKQMDTKIQNMNLNKNKNKNNNNPNYETDLQQKSFSENAIKEKELKNAISIIKILRFDNQRLQNKLDEIEKDKEAEKQAKDKNQIIIQRELQEHKLCKQKIESYHEKVKKLTEKNKSLIDKLIYGKSKNGNKTNNNNINYNGSDDESEDENSGNFYKTKKKVSNLSVNRIGKKVNLYNLRKLGDTKKNNSLPRLNHANNQQINSSKNNNTIININNIFNVDEMSQINQVFNKSKNANIYNIIIKKFEILQKSKESIDNKYKFEQKQFTKRILSMQQQIDYLNEKIRENELKINIFQAQLNESKIEKKQLLKRIKILKEGFDFSEFNPKQNEDNINNKNKEKKKNVKIPYIKLNKNKSDDSIDYSENKGQKINNDFKSGNEADSITEENFTDEIN